MISNEQLANLCELLDIIVKDHLGDLRKAINPVMSSEAYGIAMASIARAKFKLDKLQFQLLEAEDE